MSAQSRTLRPLHEILGDNLIAVSTIGLRNNGRRAITHEAMSIMDALLNAKLKTVDAHQLADQIAEVPANFRSDLAADLMRQAEELITDLRGRQDEKSATPSAQPHDGGHNRDERPLRGN